MKFFVIVNASHSFYLPDKGIQEMIVIKEEESGETLYFSDIEVTEVNLGADLRVAFKAQHGKLIYIDRIAFERIVMG